MNKKMSFHSLFLAALSIVALLFLAACAPGLVEPAAEPGASAEATAAPSPTPLDPDDPLVEDSRFYAEEMGISLEEAVERMNMQQALSESRFVEAVMANEADTFAGFWIQHEPTYAFVVALTEGGEETIRPYVEGEPFADLVEVRTHRYTHAELEAAQQETMEIVQALGGLSAGAGIDVQENQVYLEVANRELFLEEVEAAGLTLPEQVAVRSFAPDTPPEQLRGGVETYTGPQGETIYFPMQGATNIHMEALIMGTLALDEQGCLRVAGPDGTDGGDLIIWHQGFSVEVEGETITVLNDEGLPVARVGEPFEAGGGSGGAAPEIPGMPIEACPGPYWILGSIEPLE